MLPTAPSNLSDPPPLSAALKWTICAVAALGFLFDIYEVLVAPLIVPPALLELGNLRPGTPDYRSWAGLLFWIPPLIGGFCGMWGGYFADRFGRRRILVWSIMLYTVSAVAAGMSTSIEQLLIFRTLCFAGLCVEFVAAVAWVAELFPEGKTREAALGYTQAFSSLGGVMVAGAYYIASRYGSELPAIYGAHSAWRYTLISGVAPAIPLMLIRPFLPESPQWAQKKAAGTLKRPSIGELFAPVYRRTTIITTLMFACAYGAAFGTIQQSPQIAAGLSEVIAMPTAAERGQATSGVQAAQELGGLAGRVAIATLALLIVSRRQLIRLFLIPGLLLTPFIFFYLGTHSLHYFRIGIFIAGFTTVAQLTFWGSYLPRVYPVHLRGTGEGFAANVGGRMMGTSAAFFVAHLTGFMPTTVAGAQVSYAAGIIGIVVYTGALVLSFFMLEPPATLPD
ncbi:MAG: MFS transporter [Acidobacteriota bacterium]